MELFQRQGVTSRWASFENADATPGMGGRQNRGAKGCPSRPLGPGESLTLLNFAGSGTIRRIWATVDDRSPVMLRGLRLDMFWDGASKPAVSAPFGDFFGIGLGRRTAFECDLFSDPEGRSFNCLVPMPFRRHARVTVTNETDRPLRHFFYDINFESGAPHGDNMLYFHTHWRRENPGALGRDYTILPRVSGAGRFLGSNLGIVASGDYNGAWWGEGEVKVYLDGDSEFPTLVGTGAEDYIGTGWGQGAYAHRFQGCPVADSENRQWCFYRYHVPDPVVFQNDCQVTIQQIGGDSKERVASLLRAGAPLVPVTFYGGGSLLKL
ncbi:MAG: DUF2961 domain-containing protein, partial [Chloroflexi bacterium]|nr:DUF2961 domain-containing protein [Chloroflexota bacterium]